MVTPDTLSAWLKEQAVPLCILLVLLVGAFVLVKLSARRRHALLTQQRGGVNEALFVEYLAKYGFDQVITSTTYRYLQEVQGVPFPLLPSDRLDDDLGLDEEGIDQTVSELLVSLKRLELSGLRHLPLVTVEDLIRHLQAAPRTAEAMAA